jgi:hypothetical protein
MRSIHVVSMELLAGLLPIRQRLSFLNERFLVSERFAHGENR